MIEPKSKEIGGHTYTVTQLGSKLGLRVLSRVQKAGGNFFALSDEDQDYVCETFAKSCTVSGDSYGDKAPQLSSVFELHFRGKYKTLAEWFAFCMEVNYADLADGLASPAEGV